MKKGKSSEIEAIYFPDSTTECERPLFMSCVQAGFPSPAEDYIEGKLDLNKYLVKHPAATFFVRVSGDSMLNAGIHPGDILIVDRSLDPVNRKVVIAVVNGELTVKRIKKQESRLFLVPENKKYAPMEITSEMNCEIWGVVTNVIHPL
ncbi:MAG: translesion error-prone DNA polymerase V autoproteolytic subunit [Desulfobacterales bacterium]|nr:translesion error-prone DNA polymerase V autoproteolytic subunit [Desulfobacterales bacterium]